MAEYTGPASHGEATADAAKGTSLAPKRWLERFRFGFSLSFLVVCFILVALWDEIAVSKGPGEQGVYWSRFFGGTLDRILGEGTHLKFPWDKMYIYSTRVMTSSQETFLLTKDGMEIKVKWSVRYRVNPARLPILHQTLGPDYVNRMIIPEVVSALRQSMGKYSADQIYAMKEADLLKEIEEQVEARIEKFHPIEFETVLLMGLELPEKMQQGIIDKLLYEQQLLAYDFRLRAESEERNRKTIEAEGIKAFQEISGISMLKWRGIQATTELAKSPNSKIIIMGTGQNNLPLLLNADTPLATESAPERR